MPTTPITGTDVAARLNTAFPGIVIESDLGSATVGAENVLEAAFFLRDDPELDCKYLNSLTAVDWIDYFEIVYHLSSLAKNTILTLKARASHESPVVPSVLDVWSGANLQEREAYDLMGIVFSGHPRMTRIFLWEGFPGHPLRKDFLALPGGYKPGLQRFPYEFPAGQRSYPSLAETDPDAPSVPRLNLPPERPLPIEEPPPAEHPLLPETSEPEATSGAGSDPSQAGGTADEPGERP